MKNAYQRTDRVSDILRRNVSEILFREVKDPRLRFVTITHVRVSKDLKNAKIFFTTIKEGEEREAIMKGLKNAAGFVQKKLGPRLHLRYIPHISFVYDSFEESGTRIDKLLKNIEDGLTTKEQ